MANLAIQMLDWKDVLTTMISTLGRDASAIPCLMEFLRVLPEEVTEGRKINLTVCLHHEPDQSVTRVSISV